MFVFKAEKNIFFEKFSKSKKIFLPHGNLKLTLLHESHESASIAPFSKISEKNGTGDKRDDVMVNFFLEKVSPNGW